MVNFSYMTHEGMHAPRYDDFESNHGSFKAIVRLPDLILNPEGAQTQAIFTKQYEDAIVEDVYIKTQHMLVNGEEVLEFGAMITLSRKFEADLEFETEFVKELLSSARELEDSAGLTLEKSGIKNVIRVCHDEDGPIFAIVLDDIHGQAYINISNDISEFDEDKRVYERIDPLASSFDERRRDLDKFLKTYMYVMEQLGYFNDEKGFGRTSQGDFPPLAYEIKPQLLDETDETLDQKAIFVGQMATKDLVPRIVKKPSYELAKPSTRLEDIGGLDREKEVIREIRDILTHPDIIDKYKIKRASGLIIEGPPGTGKTMLADALANEIDALILEVQSDDIYNKWHGNSEKRIKSIFDFAANYRDGNLVILFDEFDTIFDTTDSTSRKVAGIFRQEMQKLSGQNPNVIVVATTERKDKIDPSLIRSGRFGYHLVTSVPGDQARSEIFLNIMSSYDQTEDLDDYKVDLFNPFDMHSIDFSAIAKASEGLSGSDIHEVMNRLILRAGLSEINTGEPRLLTTQDILDAIYRFKTAY